MFKKLYFVGLDYDGSGNYYPEDIYICKDFNHTKNYKDEKNKVVLYEYIGNITIIETHKQIYTVVKKLSIKDKFKLLYLKKELELKVDFSTEKSWEE